MILLFNLVSLDGRSANCKLDDHHEDDSWRYSAVTYHQGSVLACGARQLVDADRCWRHNGTAWYELQRSSQPHCWTDAPSLMVPKGWWVTGPIQIEDGHCSDQGLWDGTTSPPLRLNNYEWSSEIFTGEKWIEGPPHPLGKYSSEACMVNLNYTHTMYIGFDPTESPFTLRAWIYDWEAENWIEIKAPTQRWYYGCVGLGDGEVLIAGGYDLNTPPPVKRRYEFIVELYDPLKGIWSPQPDLPMKNIDPRRATLLNQNGNVLALLNDYERYTEREGSHVYKRSNETGEWSVLEGVELPSWFNGKAVLVPQDFVPTCLNDE